MRILVIRLSSMGDVALTLPVLRAFRNSFPDTELVLLTGKNFVSFFTGIRGLNIFTPNLRGRHRGITGIFRLFRDLKALWKFDCVLDLHGVIRTFLLDFLFVMSGADVSRINKGRKEKRRLINGKEKKHLIHTVERYADVFRRAGFDIEPDSGKLLYAGAEAGHKADGIISSHNINIGIAPFAKHELKQWPVENTIKLMKMISVIPGVRFWLFGGPDECARLSDIERIVPFTVNLCGKLSLDEEIAAMERLTFMVAMDSSNMHMASLAGTKVVSIWGATDPMAGFGAWGQPEEFSMRIPVDELTCRPCTIYGKGSCRRGDFTCMTWLTPEMVFEKIKNLKLI